MRILSFATALLALVALSSCRMAPTAPAQLGSIDSRSADALCRGRSSRVPTVTSVEFVEDVTAGPLHYLSIELGKSKKLGRDWTFALRVGNRWALGPGLAKYFAWTATERSMLVTYQLTPECAFDVAIGGAPLIGVTKSSIQISGGQGLMPGWPHSVPNTGTVLIYAMSDMRSPWVPAPGSCSWKSRAPLVPVQAFDFVIQRPSPSAQIADVVPPAEDAVTLRRR